MKPIYLQLLALALVSFMLIKAAPASAQSDSDYITVSGEVRDSETKKKLEYVNVFVPGTSIGTITNTDGTFSIKVKKSVQASRLAFSHVGYANGLLAIGDKDMPNVKVSLQPAVYALQGAYVGSDALELVKTAISKIADNYSSKTNLLTGFYRETIKKRSRYINISEAIVNTYKSPYGKDSYGDRIQVYKGRQLLSPKTSDTLMVKLQGGPVASIYLDVVKDWDLMLDPKTLTYYTFVLENSVMIDGQAHYVVGFKPNVILPHALLYGKLYIDEQTHTFSRIEASLSMDDQSKATQVMLKKKPFGMRFKPEELSYEISYKKQGSISYLSYVRSELRFRCDMKRKLFSSSYLVVSEMVITAVKEQDVEKIPAKLAFSEKYSLSDKITSFYDENFWEDYNIIEPTESLESAVGKLRKKIE